MKGYTIQLSIEQEQGAPLYLSRDNKLSPAWTEDVGRAEIFSDHKAAKDFLEFLQRWMLEGTAKLVYVEE